MKWDSTDGRKYDVKDNTDAAEEWDIWITSEIVKAPKPPTDATKEEEE
jgi:hypothetical protein